MSKPVNTVAIGAFVAGALLFFFAVAFYLSGNAFRGDVERGLLVFDGSVKGLNVGAPVAFKGVTIGEVTRVDLYVNTDTFAVVTPVYIRTDKGKIKTRGSQHLGERAGLQQLIDRGLRAKLETQSLLTGLLYVQLDFSPGSEERYTQAEIAPDDEDVFVIPTLPTDLERISRKLENVDIGGAVEKLSETISGVDEFINDPQMQALAGNLNKTLDAIEQLSTRLKTEVDTLSPEVNQLVGEVNRKLPDLSDAAQESLDELSAALKAAHSTLENIDYLMSDDSAVLYDMRQAAQELAAAGRALQSLAETLETQPESVLKGKLPQGN